MIGEVSTLRWHVFSGGYLCEDHLIDGKKTRSLAPDMESRDFSLRERFPLDEDPALFRKFAATELTEKGLIAFANEWGPLWDAHDFGDDFLDPDWEEENITDFTWTWVPIDRVFKEIRIMKSLVDLWDVLEGDHEKKLSDVIDVKREGDRNFVHGELTFKDVPDLRWSFFFEEGERPGGIRELARMCLLYHINSALWGTCSPWLRMGERPQNATFCLIPHSLDAALWLMFAQEVLGEKELKQCVYCKAHFEISKVKNDRRQRSDKKYCSAKCRASAFRERANDLAHAPKETQPKRKGTGKK